MGTRSCSELVDISCSASAMKRSDLDCERIAQTTVIESFKRSQQRAQSAKLVPDLCDPTVLADQGEPNFLFSLLCLAWKVVGLFNEKNFSWDLRGFSYTHLPGFAWIFTNARAHFLACEQRGDNRAQCGERVGSSRLPGCRSAIALPVCKSFVRATHLCSSMPASQQFLVWRLDQPRC